MGRGEKVRTHLLATTAAVALLAATSAQAQDATWNLNGTGNYNTASNWTPNTVPTGTAFFGASNQNNVSFSPTITTVGGWTFNSGASAYTFANSVVLSFTGAGITINGGSATINNNFALLEFNGSSTAGSATINNLGGLVQFFGSSTAGTAAITTTGNQIQFFDTSTAGNATITNNNGIFFQDSSTAGSASITNNGSANIIFNSASSAGSATITHNSNGTIFFNDNSSGGTVRLIVNAGAVDFSGLTSIGTTAGSFEGSGTFFLGSKTIAVGGNNLSTTVSGVIRDGGFAGGTGGSLVKEGTGILTLSGTNAYTGSTTVNAGALIVNGSIASSSLTTVNSGAALIGSGTVGSTVVNSGAFLVPGPVGTPGTMTVAGNLAFQSGAIYVVQVNPATASITNVSGTASLAGTVGAIFFPGTYMERSYPIVTAGGGVSGTFNNLLTVGLPTDFQASLSYTANTALLNLRAQLVPEPTPTPPPTPPPLPTPPSPVPPLSVAPAPPPPTFTVNQLNVGHAIDNFFNNGGALPPAFVSLFNLTGSNLTTALDQLSGEAATGAQKVAFQLTDQFLGLMLDPFVDGRCGIGRTDYPPLGFARDCETRPSALGFAPERETMPPAIALAYASVLKEPRAPLAPVYEPRWTAWAGAYGGSNRTTGDGAIIGSHDLSARTVGGAAGLDYHLTPDAVVGFALGGGGTDWSLSQGLGGGKSDAFQAGLYGATRWGPAYLAADFAFTNHWMSTDRLAVGDHLTADFNAQSYGGRLEGGYRFGMLYGGITPYAAIQAQSFHTPGFTETDVIANGFGLAFGSRDATDTRSELGTRFDRVLAVYSNAVLALRGRVAWAHDWVSDATLMPVFQSLPGASFIVNGATLPKNSAVTSAGAELRLANGVTLLAKFDGEFASHSSTYGGTGTLRYRW
ncbi:MAG: autotransporter domain-containing protein [Hyphomicrobiales bacterium]|nr:autotransporter domain-containing protein [Hyphomicrobiales bacterium]